ncbi:MAG: hypothetical protein ACOX52_03350 [Verrucomicrobiota bacterium]
MDLSNFAAKWCQDRTAVPGFSCPNPITRPFDTETDSDPDPDLASPWTFSDGLRLVRPHCLSPATTPTPRPRGR